MNQYLKPQPKKLKSKIKHIVVLMLENRSFDNLLGWLYEDRKIPKYKSFQQSFEGLKDDLWNPLDNIDSDGLPFIEKIPIARNGQKKKWKGKLVPNPPDFTLPDPDPGEGFADTNHQLFLEYRVNSLYPPEPTNMGFVQNYQNAMLYGKYAFNSEPTDPRKIMRCYTPKQTPVLSELARSYAVCDQYYASVPSQTLPNRSFVHAGTSCGNVNNSPNPFCEAETIFNQIQDEIENGNKGLSWGVFGDNLFERKNDKPGKFGNNHFSLTRLAMTRLHDCRFDDNFHTLEHFHKLCKNGKLPSYSFLEPKFSEPGQSDQHPPADIRTGENLIADLYNSILKSKAYKETLFIINYDEHGGCYDHVAPPKGAKNPDPKNRPGQDGFRFNRFGLRVPCILINPYIPKGLIARPAGYTPFDHTSVIKTVQNCLGLKPELTARSNAAPDFSCALLLDKPRTRKTLPEITKHKLKSTKKVTELNHLHRQMADMICKLSGKSCPDDSKLLPFIQQNYDILLGKER